jgi:hypothetical protein
MADFWGSVGNWFGNMTGVNQANQAADQNAAGMEAAQQGGATMGSAAGIAGQAAGRAGKIADMSAGQYAQQAGQAGQALGEQMGRTAATQGTQAATQAARTSGVNKGQAALLGSQQAGNAFTNAQTAGQQLGMGAYGQGASNQLGAVNAQTGAAGTQGNIGAQQGQLGTNLISAGQGAAKQGTDAGGGLLSAIGSLIKSDENAKKDIKAAPDLKETTKKVTPSAFKYKDDPEEKEQVGVMAQDLEKTPMASNVVDTPEGKMVDTGKQEMSNTALIMQLAKKVEELEAKLKGGKDA